MYPVPPGSRPIYSDTNADLEVEESRHGLSAALQLLGWFGFLGIGQLMRNRFGTFLAQLVLWWVYLAGGAFIIGITPARTGIAWIVTVLFVTGWLGIPAYSSYRVYHDRF